MQGRRYGPVETVIGDGQAAAYAAATGDLPPAPGTAPPSFAGALLFSVTPALQADLGAAAASILHADQTFRWHQPLRTGVPIAVEGVVGRVRARGDLSIVVFDVTVTETDGTIWLTGRSTFLAGGAPTPASETAEPAVDARGPTERPEPAELPAAGEGLPPLRKSASRSDLIRYAGASHDWNPIHWDHAAAVAAGLEGVIVHGLLESAWLLQAGARYGRPEAATFRYRKPLRPGVAAEVAGTVADAGPPARLDLRLESAAGVHVTAQVDVGR